MFPKLISFHGFTLPTYGVLVAIGFVAGLLVAMHLANREHLDKQQVYNLGIYLALAGMLGSKLFLLIQDHSYYWNNPREIFSFSTLQSGGVFYGGVLVGIAVAIWYARSSGMPFLKTADAFAPGIALGHAFGRLGCFSAGCCWGLPTSLPWGVTFTSEYSHEVIGVPIGVKLHPTQLYEAAAEAVIFVALYLFYKRKRFDGQILGWYLILYPTARFLVEFLRSHVDEALIFGRISDAQAISLGLIATGIWLLWLRPERTRQTVASVSSSHSHGPIAARRRPAKLPGH
jgi:phosphatidylglycerol:prolipoprotein diacylglycerol transferase